MERKDFNCDVCNSDKSIEVPYSRYYTKNAEPLFICMNCGLVYAKSRRSIKAVADSWNEEIFGNNIDEKNYTSENPWIKGRLTFVTEFIEEKVGLKGKKVCDIGAGEGLFLRMAKEKGADVFGIEPSQKNCSKIKSYGINCFNGTIQEFVPYIKNYKADIISVMWTLECSALPKQILQIGYEFLNDGGFFVIATGSRIMVPFKKPLFMYFSKERDVDTHPIHLSYNTLKGLFAVNHFEPIYENQYIDNDLLIIIAQKVDSLKKIEWKGDDYLKVAHFFERWHKESLYYR